MRKLLPIIFLIIFAVGLVTAFPLDVSAQAIPAQTPLPEPGSWVADPDVTFAGKNAKRSGYLLDWVIANYQWSYVAPGSENPFILVWSGVRNVMYALVPLGIIVAAFLIIITRGQNIQYKKFVIRLLIVVALITLSYAIISFIYGMTDLIQLFFLRRGDRFIASQDLLSVAFDYENFNGLRRFGEQFDESAFVSMLLVKLTAASYYAVFLVLMIRKIILWFFIILSPIFALLFLFSPLRNTGKIWLGEFLRWTLYGPLFAILLSGLVVFWQNWTPNAPLHLNGQTVVRTGDVETNVTVPAYALPCDQKPADDDVIFPTAINILIGGPCQAVSSTNNINVPASFIQYLVALLMIWMVIILPFILLKIFLDYLKNFEYSDSNIAKYVTALRNLPVAERYRGGASPPPGRPPEPSLSGGVAKELPIGASSAAITSADISANMTAYNAEKSSQTNAVGANQATTIDSELAKALQQNLNKSQQEGQQSLNQMAGALSQTGSESANSAQSSELLNLANLSIPNMQEVAKFEASLLSSEASARADASKIYEALNRIAGTSNLTTPAEKEQYSKITEKVVQEAASGNNVAGAIMAASSAVGQRGGQNISQIPKLVVQNYQAVGKISNVAAIPNMSADLKLGKLEDALKQESSFGNPVANAMLANVPALPPNTPPEKKVTAAQAYLNNYEAVAKVTEAAQRTDLSDEQKLEEIKVGLEKEAKAGNPLAVSIISVLTLAAAQLPDENAVQQVNLDDYEQVKRTWVENFRNLEVPPDSDGRPRSRKEWLESEINQIPQAVSLMQSADPQAQQQAKAVVSKILPFLLLGGFSKAEISAYLKAKEEAAKTVMGELQKSDNEAEYVDRAKSEEKPKAMTMEAQAEPAQPVVATNGGEDSKPKDKV